MVASAEGNLALRQLGVSQPPHSGRPRQSFHVRTQAWRNITEIADTRRTSKRVCMYRLFCLLTAAIVCAAASAQGQTSPARPIDLTFPSSTYNDFRQLLAREAGK